MSDFLHDPPRWKDRTDQARLAERAAGKMVRAMGRAEALSGPQLARIAARIRGQQSRPRRLRLWAPAVMALLFGGVAAASAARLDVLPRWLSDIVRPGPVVSPPLPSRPRTFRGRSKPVVPAPAPLPAPAPAATPTLDPAAAPAPLPATQSPAPQVEPARAEQAPPSLQPTLAPQSTSAFHPLPAERVREPGRTPAARSVQAKSAQPVAQAVPLPPVQPAPAPPQPEIAAAQVTAAPAQAAGTPDPLPAVDWPKHPIAPVATTRQLAWVDPPSSGAHAPARTVPEARQAAPAPAEPGAGPLKHLSAAVRALRAEHSPQAALALLDRHGSELEKSSVSHEALLLRVEAMLKLERRSEALGILDAAPLAGVAASRTLLLIRGELRAAAGRCAEAVTDFDVVLVQTQGRNKRALAGLARCQKAAEPSSPSARP